MANVKIQMTPSGATLAQQLEPSTPDDLADLVPRDARALARSSSIMPNASR